MPSPHRMDSECLFSLKIINKINSEKITADRRKILDSSSFSFFYCYFLILFEDYIYSFKSEYGYINIVNVMEK